MCVYLRFETHTNPQGWLPHCRPDGLRWQGKVHQGQRRRAKKRVWAGIILTLTTESIEEHTEKQKCSVHSWDTTKYRTKKLNSHLTLEASTSSPFFIHIRLFSS